MRQKRAKTYRKLLEAYIRHFGLRPPLQVLLDAPMVLALVREKLSAGDVALRLESVLQASAALGARFNTTASMSGGYSGGGGGSTAAEKKAGAIKPMITQCCIAELYAHQRETGERLAVEMAKTFERRRCNHRDAAIPGERCLLDVLGPTNKHRYVLASDSAGLRAAVRRDVLAVPVCHHNERNVLVLEPMSDKTRLRCEELERAKLDLSASRTVLGKRSGDIVGLDDEDGEHHNADADGEAAGTGQDRAKVALPRKKRPKGPNPLSVKKSTSLKKKKGKGGEKPSKEQGGDKKSGGASGPASHGGAEGGGEGGAGGGKRKRRKRGHVSAATDQAPSS